MLIIFIISILLYINTWNFGFASDDTMMITENNFTKGGIDKIGKIFTTDAFAGFLGEGKNLLSGGRYRPLSQLIFNIEYSFGGLCPHFWHIQNTLAFALGMVLVYLMLQKLFNKENTTWMSLPFIATLLISVHPLNTEVVANIKSFDLLLSLLFSILSLMAAINYYDKGKTRYLIYLFISLFLGILAKETALTFLGIIPLALLLFRPFDKKHFLLVFGISSLSILSYFIFRIAMIGMPHAVKITELLNNPFLEASTSQKYATISYTWWHYLQLFVFPIHLTHDYYPYTISLKSWTSPISIASILLYVSLSIWSLIKVYSHLFRQQKTSIIAFGWLFYIFVFSISSNLFVNIGAFMNERFIFIADIGLAIIVAYFIIDISLKTKRNTQILYLILTPILLIYSVKTIKRNKAWKNDYTLFTTDVIVSANSAKCNVSAGGKTYEKALKESSQIRKNSLLRKAESFLQKGIHIHPKYVQAYTLLGNVYFEEKKYNQCFQAYAKSISLGERKDSKANIKSLALKLHQRKDYGNSLKVLQYYEKTFKTDEETSYFIADDLLNLNKIDTAISILNALIEHNPNYDEAYNKLGEIYGRYKNDFKKSEYYLQKAYSINPTNASVCENLGVLYGIEGSANKSIHFFKESLKNRKKPTAQIYQNMAASYAKIGDKKQAQKYLNMAKSIR